VAAAALTPNELIRALLRAPVDLLWNGGIGTFVKAKAETHAEVGDRSTDAVRVDAEELRCRVVAEGGNLGLTQRARIAFALHGGRLDRALEFLPDEETLAERRAAGHGLTAPEFAVLLSHTKIGLYDAVCACELPDDPALAFELERYFPTALRERFGSQLWRHP